MLWIILIVHRALCGKDLTVLIVYHSLHSVHELNPY